MPLDLSMIDSAVRIIGDESVLAGTPRRVTGTRRVAIGTGFLITVLSEADPETSYGYAVSAHHVIDGERHVEVQVPNPFANGELYPPVTVEDWRQPLPDVDLALAPIGPAPEQTWSAMRLEHHLIPNEVVLAPMLGGRVYYVGILTPLDRPMVRSATIGALDQSGVRYQQMYDFPVHLVDCRSYGGFSGSPCFVESSFAVLHPSPVPGALANRVGEQLDELMGDLHHWVGLCGMFVAHLTDDASNISSEYGVGVMLRGNEIREALMTDENKAERSQWDEQIAARPKAGPTLKLTKAGADEDEFGRFEDLTRKLVNTPKPEVDEKRTADQ